MRGTVSGLLWNLVLHRSDLLGNLAAMRNYFLLGRGDFYQQLLDEVRVPAVGAVPHRRGERGHGLPAKQPPKVAGTAGIGMPCTAVQ